jgi:hypothetical protein
MRHMYQCLLALLVAAALSGCSAVAAPADITIGERGCTSGAFTLPASREPRIVLRNDAAERMVFTLPKMNRWIALAPGQQASFELPRYIMGRFDFFCLTEAEHARLAGGNPYLCSLEPAELAPVARSAGTFEIAPHNRIKELTGSETGR